MKVEKPRCAVCHGEIHRCVLCRQEVEHGRYACLADTEDIRHQLRETEAYLPMVQLMPTLLRIPGRGDGRRSPGFGSAPPPGLVESLHALDERVAVAGEGEDGQSVAWRLDSLCQLVREERDQGDTYEPTLMGMTAYLLWTAEWCAHQPWVDEHAENIRDLRNQVRRLAHDAPPGPIGDCMNVECDGKVFWGRDVLDHTDPEGKRTLDAGRCAKCHDLYYGTRLVRLRSQKREAS